MVMKAMAQRKVSGVKKGGADGWCGARVVLGGSGTLGW